jgi:hypothetical protein
MSLPKYVFFWQNCRYSIQIKGYGSNITGIDVDGQLWPSSVLPAKSSSVIVYLGEEKTAIPWITSIDSLSRLISLKYDASLLRLQGEIMNMADKNSIFSLDLPHDIEVSEMSHGLLYKEKICILEQGKSYFSLIFRNKNPQK